MFITASFIIGRS
jgi:hypothetical protein